MNVRELMSSPVSTCSPEDTLEDAARLLWENDCGILPVVDHNGQLGSTITDRDICMAAYTQGVRLADAHVADSMSRQLVTCLADDPIASATGIMAANRVRRLPVVDADGKLCGVLSLNDLATKAAKDKSVGREILKVLAAVCQPHVAGDPVVTASSPAAKVQVGGQS